VLTSKNISSYGVYFRKTILCISSAVMSGSLRNKRSLTNKIDSNKVERDQNVVKKRKHLTIKSDDETSISNWKPPDWETTIQNIRKMRKSMVAPVDDMGCDQAADMNESPEVCARAHVVQHLTNTHNL